MGGGYSLGIYCDCGRCGLRVEVQAKDIENPICDNCKILHGDDIQALIKYIKSKKTPGQEHVLRVIELLHKRVQILIDEA